MHQVAVADPRPTSAQQIDGRLIVDAGPSSLQDSQAGVMQLCTLVRSQAAIEGCLQPQGLKLKHGCILLSLVSCAPRAALRQEQVGEPVDLRAIAGMYHRGGVDLLHDSRSNDGASSIQVIVVEDAREIPSGLAERRPGPQSVDGGRRAHRRNRPWS